MNTSARHISFALNVLGICTITPASAVRLNQDGLGQALIYPYYTARSTPAGNSFVTLFTVSNVSSRPKALRVRFLEGKAGGEVLNFNLFLSAYDVWTAGIVPTATGAGIFSADHSCTSATISRSAAAPIVFDNNGYRGDLLGDDLDRTREGYFEILEMGTIDAMSDLGVAVTQHSDYTAPNVSRPTCAGLPTTAAVPAGMTPPTGGLMGNVSYINVNDGTNYTTDAVALSQWSDKVQWAQPGSTRPSLADASPPVSYVVDSSETSDRAYLTQWSRGKDAVSAVLMIDEVINEYTVEPNIKAATDWILTAPTKRFHTTPTSSESPFAGDGGFYGGASKSYCEFRLSCSYNHEVYYDREAQTPGGAICFTGSPPGALCGTAATINFAGSGAITPFSYVFQSANSNNVSLNTVWINGILPYPVVSSGKNFEYEATGSPGLPAQPGATTIIDTRTGAISRARR